MDPSSIDLGSISFLGIFGGLLFSTFGVYFIKRGKKDASLPKVGIGLVLLVYPYFVPSTLLLWVIGAVFLFLGFKVG